MTEKFLIQLSGSSSAMGVGSFYKHANDCSVTKPSGTLPKLSFHDAHHLRWRVKSTLAEYQ